MSGRVLIVDDDPDIREAVAMVLDLYGVQALPLGDPHQALRLLTQPDPPAAVLLDMRMPALSGEEFLAAMRQLGLLGRIPVVVLSGDTTARAAAHASGADAFLAKPVEVEQLVQTVSQLLGAHGGHPAP
jgi:CheY-like chemotaxis protein